MDQCWVLEKRHAGPGGADLPSQLLRRMTQEDKIQGPARLQSNGAASD